MPSPSPEALQKVTMNLYEKDVAEMTRLYARGWTSKVRELVRDHINERKKMTKPLSLRRL